MSIRSGHITVVAVGKMRKPHWKTALDDYQKRLKRYTHFELIEVKDVVGHGRPDAVAAQKEGEALLKAAAGAHRIIALTENGRQLDSPGLAKYVQREVERYGRIAFLIAGPVGFAPETLAQCHEQLSLSPLTFPHEMARVILLEQLYRACTILNGEKYHK